MKLRLAAKQAALALLFMVAGSTASASIAYNGALSMPHFMSSGIVLVYTSGSRANPPACGAGQANRFAFDATTPGGKIQLAGLLTAFATGKQVVIVGSDTCGVWSDTETVNYFYIAD
jgi:hypothetical protein